MQSGNHTQLMMAQLKSPQLGSSQSIKSKSNAVAPISLEDAFSDENLSERRMNKNKNKKRNESAMPEAPDTIAIIPPPSA